MKKIAQIILICLVLAGIIVIATLGFNVGVRYGENTQININIGKEFDSKDIKNIAKEVFGNQSVIVEYVEIYKDVVQITVKDATDDEMQKYINGKEKDKLIEYRTYQTIHGPWTYATISDKPST